MVWQNRRGMMRKWTPRAPEPHRPEVIIYDCTACRPELYKKNPDVCVSAVSGSQGQVKFMLSCGHVIESTFSKMPRVMECVVCGEDDHGAKRWDFWNVMREQEEARAAAEEEDDSRCTSQGEIT